MVELRIVLNRNHPDYERIAGGIRKNLNELESVTVKEVTEAQKPGTLTAEWTQVTEFILQHAAELTVLARAVIEMATAVVRMRAAKNQGKDSEKPVVIKSSGGELALPASDQKRRRSFSRQSKVGTSTAALQQRPKPRLAKYGSGALERSRDKSSRYSPCQLSRLW